MNISNELLLPLVHEYATKSNSQNSYVIKHKTRFWIRLGFLMAPDLVVFLV